MYSKTSVTGVVSKVTVHWPGSAYRPDLLNSAGSSGRVSVVDHVDPCSTGLWPGCLFSSRSLAGEVLRSLFICHYVIALLLMVLSLLFTAPVRGGIVLCLPRVLIEFLRWTVVNVSRIKSSTWWMCNMASGTDRPGADGAGVDFPVR